MSTQATLAAVGPDKALTRPEHKSLLEALLAFQAEAPTLPKDAENPHYRSKYVPLDTIVERIQPLLTKHGLVWTAFPVSGEHGPALRYQLAHAATGDVMSGEMPLLLSKQDPQGQGSALTYARRYSMTAVLNLVADVDDDGNGGSGGLPPGQRQASQPDRVPSDTGVDVALLDLENVELAQRLLTPEAALKHLSAADTLDLKRALNERLKKAQAEREKAA